ncbi:hypothetical protein [Rathayibacter oskolensis]|uniref:hypothetical protein n=1 Tax=Rathayibacter oskolensis TaxID=1891671 RepID=UPI001FCA795A|nr:hypothetical protein [Rathayibacter oskolensis]
MAHDDELPGSREFSEDPVENPRTDRGVRQVVAGLLKKREEDGGCDGRIRADPAGPAIVTSEAELDGTRAPLEFTAILLRGVSSGLLDGQTRNRFSGVPPSKSVWILRSDHSHAVEARIAEPCERRLEGGLPVVVLIAGSDPVEEEQNRFIRQGTLQITRSVRRS